MAANNSGEQSPQPHGTFGEIAKRAGLFLLFGTILLIPRIRRLRRRVWAWSCVRLGVAAGATWMGWRYKHANAGTPSLILSVVLFAFSLFMRARPEEKSVDALASELNALTVLNGGVLRLSPDAEPVERTDIFVHPARIIVYGPRSDLLLEIPFAAVQSLTAHAIAKGSGKGHEPWEVTIDWVEDGPCRTTFRYEGAFAEHLARVTESTLRSVRIKELPVIQP